MLSLIARSGFTVRTAAGFCRESRAGFASTGGGRRTIVVISKIDQASGDQKILAAVQALLSNQGPPKASDIPWVALIGQSVAIASAQSGSVGHNSLETAWRAESESLKSILAGAPQGKLGRVALVDTVAQQICKRMKVRLPNLLSGFMSCVKKTLRGSSEDIGWLERIEGLPPVTNGTTRFLELLYGIRSLIGHSVRGEIG